MRSTDGVFEQPFIYMPKLILLDLSLIYNLRFSPLLIFFNCRLKNNTNYKIRRRIPNPHSKFHIPRRPL
jgi:hypothetical protein